MTKYFVYGVTYSYGELPRKFANGKVCDTEKEAMNTFMNGFREWILESDTYTYTREEVVKEFPDNISFAKLYKLIGTKCIDDDCPYVLMEKIDDDGENTTSKDKKRPIESNEEDAKFLFYGFSLVQTCDPEKFPSAKLMKTEEEAMSSFLKGFRPWYSKAYKSSVEQTSKLFPDNISYEQLQLKISKQCRLVHFPYVYMEKVGSGNDQAVKRIKTK